MELAAWTAEGAETMQAFDQNLVTRGFAFRQTENHPDEQFARDRGKGFWPLIEVGAMQPPRDWLASQ